MKRRSLGIFILLLGISLFIFLIPLNQVFFKEGELRAAIDIGSGATNLKIAQVNPKTNKIIKIIFEKSIPVAYQKHLEQSSDETFDAEIMRQGVRSIKELKEIADQYRVKKILAIATAAFRKAQNAKQFAKEIEEKTSVQVRIINQDEEGILAFRGALAVTNAEPQHTVTWDIGGGSMQLTALTHAGTYLIDKGKTASIPFKNASIQQIKGQDLKTTSSPNPMTREEMKKASQYANQLSQEADPFIKEKLIHSKTRVLGVGNLLNYGVAALVKDTTVTQESLQKAVMQYANKTDAELPGGSLAEVAVSNPLLVLGYMEGLQIDRFQVVNVNNADGALTYPPYWQ